MTSILTNNGAMVALQTLKGINSQLGTIQEQISTGKKVGTAKDNAAVWAISKTMEADVASFDKVSEGLAVASSTVAVARDATETVTDLLKQMKEKAVQAASATTTASDRAKIDADVQALREQIGSVVASAQFNGVNLIDGKNTGNLSVLSSLDRSGTGTVSPNHIDVAYADMSENNTAVAATFGGTAVTADTYATNDAGTVGTAAAVADAASHTFSINATGEGVSFRVTLDGGTTNFEYVANASDSTDDVARKLEEQLSATYGDGASFEVVRSGSDITVTNVSGAPSNFNIETATGGTAAESGGLGGLASIDVVNDAAGALASLDSMIAHAVDVSSQFGTAQNQLDTQRGFVSKLTDNLKAGIGSMVDADMEEASARLQALQVQQQLGVQSLSIANQAPQSVMSLFR